MMFGLIWLGVLMLSVKLKRSLAVSDSPVDKDVLKAEPPSTVAYIESVLRERTRKRNFFRPSMLNGCDRQNVFHYTQAPSMPQRQDPRIMRILDNGTKVHELLQAYLSDHSDVWFAPESRIFVEINGALVRGSCDGVLIRRSDMYRWGIEIKTINHDEFMKLSKPKKEHIAQAMIYMAVQKLYWVTIIYWDKDKQHLKEYPIPFDAVLWKQTQERIKMLKTFVDSGTLPAYDKGTCNTFFCQYVDHCREKGAPV